MAELKLKLIEGVDEPYVEFYVDGVNLAERVLWEGVLPWFGGDYELNDTVLGQPARTTGAGQLLLFVCGCGHYACSSIRVDVDVAPAAIVFRNFVSNGSYEIPHEPVSFARDQYEAAITDLMAQIAAFKPTPRDPST